VASETPGSSLTTRETVLMPTPAKAATSRILGLATPTACEDALTPSSTMSVVSAIVLPVWRTSIHMLVGAMNASLLSARVHRRMGPGHDQENGPTPDFVVLVAQSGRSGVPGDRSLNRTSVPGIAARGVGEMAATSVRLGWRSLPCPEAHWPAFRPGGPWVQSQVGRPRAASRRRTCRMRF
jgi:hypothetical protein